MRDKASHPVLEINDLKTHFFTDDGVIKAVDGVHLKIEKGKVLGVVGESGCGKSVTALSILRLVSKPGRIVDGKILLEGNDIIKLSDKEMRQVRGGVVSMIFQEPMTSLNPVFTVGDQIVEAIVIHQKKSKSESKSLAIDMLRKVRIPEPELRVDEYPHQFSGGMRQRAMIAMALSCNPKLLIADEPTTALDVTIQAQILDLLKDLQREFGLSIMIITHDLGVIAEVADDVAVMYASKIVEYTDVVNLYKDPLHPYTNGLFESRPKADTPKSRRMNVIQGAVPNPLDFPTGCKFHTRCPFVQEKCKTEEPVLKEIKPGHMVSCHFAGQLNFDKNE